MAKKALIKKGEDKVFTQYLPQEPQQRMVAVKVKSATSFRYPN